MDKLVILQLYVRTGLVSVCLLPAHLVRSDLSRIICTVCFKMRFDMPQLTVCTKVFVFWFVLNKLLKRQPTFVFYFVVATLPFC